MKLEFSDHAIEQQKIRKIPKMRIIDTVRDPEETEASFRGRVLSRRSYRNKMLEVVTITEEKRIIVVTAYYLENI